MLGNLASRLSRLEREVLDYSPAARRFEQYVNDPVGYCRDVLHVTLTDAQAEIARSLLEPPRRVLVKSGHNIGKTFLAAAIVNWWYDTRDPGVVISTAPTERDVIDLLWTEIRLQRRRAELGDLKPAAPEMRSSDNHWAKGYTARKGESFQGRHRERMLFVFDEAVGVDPVYWTTTRTMFKPEEGHAWLCIGNPTDTTSQAYLEDGTTDAEGNPAWRTFSLSSLDHPNIAAGLAGEPLPVPSAVTVEQVTDWVQTWCDPVEADDRQETDIEWPPGSGHYHRPGPEFESRVLGLWPSAGTYGVWSDYLWKLVENLVLPVPYTACLPEIGADVARYGDDWTCLHVRWGPVSIWHESHNGWSIPRTAGRLKDLAYQFAADATARHDVARKPIDVTEILVKIDDDGVGGGVTDLCQAWGLAAIPVNGLSVPTRQDRYPNRRSELWFQTAARARLKQVSVAKLPRPVRQRLRVQAMAPTWKMDGAGRRVVERKEETKEKIGRSPDDMDAMNLAYLEGLAFERPQVAKQTRPSAYPGVEDLDRDQRRREAFGR